MSSTYYHGVKYREIPTGLIAPTHSLSALPIVFGCAPIHRLGTEDRARVMPGKLAMVHSLSEAAERFGIDVQRDSFAHWTLSEAAYTEFILFNVAPAVYANLFNPDIHRKIVSDEQVALAGGRGVLSFPDVIGYVTLAPAGGGAAFAEGDDYFFSAVTGEITVLEGGAMAAESAVKASYAYAAPELVTVDDCIGGYDAVTRITTGISLADNVFPQFREVPAIGLAPKFGEDPIVAAILAAKMKAVNAEFGGVAVVDIPSDGPNAVKEYTEAPAYKNQNNLVSENLYLCWPKVKFGDHTLRKSLQAAALMAQVDAENGGVPFASPSNHNLQMTASVVDGEEIWLDVEKANFLNRNGIATAVNHTGGWVLWGNRTACAPDNTDPKDYFLPGRRMMCWYGNNLVKRWWQKVDWPMTRRLAQIIVNSEQMRLNSMAAAGQLHGGRIRLLQDENPITDLMDGKIRFHVSLGIISPAEQIEFILEYDPTYLKLLFDTYILPAA